MSSMHFYMWMIAGLLYIYIDASFTISPPAPSVMQSREWKQEHRDEARRESAELGGGVEVMEHRV